MDVVREALQGAIAACQRALLELERQESGVRAEESVVGAGARAVSGPERLPQPQTQTSEAIGTRVASLESLEERRERDRSIDRSSLSPVWSKIELTSEEVVRSPVIETAHQIYVALQADLAQLGMDEQPAWWNGNRRLEVAAALIGQAFGAVGQRWLAENLAATRECARDNPYGFFRRCLTHSLRDLDPSLPLNSPGERNCPAAIFRRIVNRVKLPEQWANPSSVQRKVS